MTDARTPPEKFHVRCTHLGCRWHVTARGRETAEKVRDGHIRTTDHDVEIVADEIVSFSRASELSFPDPSTS
jgi:hypothetical protein